MKEILKQIEQGEGSLTEFKCSFQKEVIESIVAFANAKGGKVFIGINDSKEVIGIKIGEESVQKYINTIKQNTSPSIIPDISIITLENKNIAVIEVKEFPIKPVSYKNRYYLRRANSNHIMAMEEIANEYLKTKNSSWDYYADSMHNFNDISLEKIEKFIQKIEINLNKKFDETPMQVLQKYGLVRDDKITFGAYLLFVKDLASFII